MNTGLYKEGKETSEFKGMWGGVVAPALTAIMLSKGVPMEQTTQLVVALGGILSPVVAALAYIVHRYKIKKMAAQPNEVVQLLLKTLQEDPELRKEYVKKFIEKGEISADI